MILVGDTIVSDEIKEQFFVCDLSKCKGACCVEGDYGAPLEAGEAEKLAEIYDVVKPYLSKEGIAAIEEQGTATVDPDGDECTPTIADRECAYAFYDEKGMLKCGIEQAYIDGKTDWKKPISCHLYPIRIAKYDHYDALNYHRWHICSPACTLGRELAVPLYVFLKDALIRKYGEDWYAELLHEIETGDNPQEVTLP